MDPNLPPEETTPPTPPAAFSDRAGTETQSAPERPSPSPEAEVSEPAADVNTEPTPAGETPTAATDPLTALADQALKGRLSPAEEERVSILLKEALLEGRKGVERVVEQLPKLPWIVGVNSVVAVWPELKTVFRARLVGGLAKLNTDAARRVRLSLSRGLLKQDIPAALKLAIGVAKEIRDKETGAVSSRNAQIFANVFIGRAKPWIAQIPLAELKPADAELLVHCALMTVFGLPHAPVTQLGVLKWAGEAGRLAKLQPAALETVTRTVSRWGPKWQSALQKEVSELPPELAALKPAAPAENAPRGGRERPANRVPEGDRPEAEPEDSAPGSPGSSASPAREAAREGDDSRPEDGEDEDEDDETAESGEPPRQQPPPQRQRPVYESKTIPSQPGPTQQRRPQPGVGFNLTESLRQIESHVAGLRSELQATQIKLRQQRDDEARKPRRGASERGAGIIVSGEPTIEELARLNRQLEARIGELQQRIEELTVDSEDRAASMAAPDAAAAPDVQFRTLLSLKLQEDFEDFAALEKEEPDIVVQQHYRTVLRHVFEVLRAEGVRLRETGPH